MKKQENMYDYFEREYHLSNLQVNEVLNWMDFHARNTFLEYWGLIESSTKVNKKEYTNKAEKDFFETVCILLISNRYELSKDDTKAIGMMIADMFRINTKDVWNQNNSAKYDAKYFAECMERYLTDKERIILQSFYGFSDGRRYSVKEIAKEKLKHSQQWIYTCLHKAKNKLLGRYYSDQGLYKFMGVW